MSLDTTTQTDNGLAREFWQAANDLIAFVSNAIQQSASQQDARLPNAVHFMSRERLLDEDYYERVLYYIVKNGHDNLLAILRTNGVAIDIPVGPFDARPDELTSIILQAYSTGRSTDENIRTLSALKENGVRIMHNIMMAPASVFYRDYYQADPKIVSFLESWEKEEMDDSAKLQTIREILAVPVEQDIKISR